ncbi:Putative universal stress protein [Planococcus massiliensis]|uniref:Universal stress protein n=1 Tax=Planococcus massiliensis TaxID=1499687 RepID=A0A098EQ74_9BACL|nr:MULTISPECIES: universal stress protein [Planococcus]MCJ1909860.1 universal stress protein [Planococcus ruber]CEG23927.1 Putative universal stress protein [Planococcus massiliensis]
MALEYKHILVAVDGSKEAEWAFRKSIEMAKKHNASLNLIHVVDTRSYTAMTKRIPSESDTIFEEGRALIEKYKNEAISAGLSDVSAFVAPGSPKKVISRDFANQVDADLIICGAQGLNAFEKYLMGSVSQHIVSNSSCDVLVVRREYPAKEAN